MTIIQGGPGGFGEGMGAMMGMQRLMRQAANRLRFGFYTRYGNSILDARPYSLTEADPAKMDTYRFRGGVNLGGPLKLGKLYDGRDKTFFFVNYDADERRNSVDTFATVPTALERTGDFTARGAQLFDPNSSSTGPRTPLGSVIPAAMQDPAAVGLLQFIPLPNVAGTDRQNFHLQGRVPFTSNRLNLRFVHTISPKLNFSTNYNAAWTRQQGIANFPALGSKGSSLGQNFAIGLTQQYSPRLSHDTRLNWSRNSNDTLNRFAFVNDIAGNLGITGISTDPINYGVPQVGFTNFTGLSDPVPSRRHNQTLRFTDSVQYTHKKHTWRAGAEIRRVATNTQNDPTARGAFTFTGYQTSDLIAPAVPGAPPTPVAGTGLDFADFLLGFPQATNVRFGSSRTYFRSWGLVGYVQDDWRWHPRFTVNWGLRYEFITPPYELFNKLANIEVDSALTTAAVVLPGQVSPITGGTVPRALIRNDNNNWAPRLGLAWRPKLKKNTTVRAGYSLFHNGAIYPQLAYSLANQPPHAQAQQRITDAAQVLTLTNGFPPATPGQARNTIAVDPDYRVGYAQIWNLGVESELVKNIITEVTYTGTKGTHLDLLRSPNRITAAGTLLIPSAAAFTYDTFGASSIYHALRVRVQRRFTRGFMLMGMYTYGKSIDNASSIGGGAQTVVQDDNNFRAERGLSAFDIRHQFNSFYMWELPFGERKRWAKKGTAAKILGSWSVNGSTMISSGTPFTARVLGNAANNSGTGTGSSFSGRADQVGDPSLPSDQRTPLHFFNTAAFTSPAAGQFGNAARNTIPGPGAVLFNLSAGKNIRLGKDGQRRLDLRWEVQNLLNTPNFTGLNTVVDSRDYGRVQGTRAMRTMDFQARFNF